MLGGIPLIAMELVMTSDHPLLMKMVIGITFVDGTNHPLHLMIRKYLLTEQRLPHSPAVMYIREEILVLISEQNTMVL